MVMLRKQISKIAVILVVLLAIGISGPTPASACIVILKEGETYAEYRERHLATALEIDGSLKLHERPTSANGVDAGDRVIAPLFAGVVTGANGQQYMVNYRPAGTWVVNDTACGIFALPENDIVSGTFYLIREDDSAYRLMHFVPVSED
ncbi:hypothetical protein [Sphingomicrobium flavum]|uniref:hypothetical protein n=1 Tax=Sphingomicrobium flavum TaxID=1229164 RepID=UPI0021AD9E8E|nr:hypothetical protein [Sphingomicrobium flavum]